MNNVTIHSVLDETAKQLSSQGISNARLDVEVLCAYALGCNRLELPLLWKGSLTEAQKNIFEKTILLRKKRVPVAYIVKEKEFYGLSFEVSEQTLVPRPETEHLVEYAIELINKNDLKTVLELGTGSGCISISLATLIPNIKIYATDISLAALKMAKTNAEYHDVSARILFKDGDLFKAIESEALEGYFDCIVSNPPYIPEGDIALLDPEVKCEPINALAGGTDGLDFYRVIFSEGQKYIKRCGYVVVELNSQYSKKIVEIAQKNCFNVIELIKDYSGHDRVLVVQRKE